MQSHLSAVLRIDPADDVAVAIRQLEPGERVSVAQPGGELLIEVRELIPRGHKLAVRRDKCWKARAWMRRRAS
jgi:hypothetical protein